MKVYYCDGAVASDTDATDPKLVNFRDNLSQSSLAYASQENNTSSCYLSSNDTESSGHYHHVRILGPLNEPVYEMALLSGDDDEISNEYVNIPVQNRNTSSKHPSQSRGCSCDCFSHREKPSVTSYGRRLVIISVLSVTFSVLSCGFAAVGFVYNPVFMGTSSTKTEKDYETCVPCTQLSEDTFLRSQLTLRTLEFGVEICCARTSDQMSVLAQLVINQQRNDTVVQAPGRSTFRFSPVSAHKHLHPWPGTHTDEPRFKDKRYQLSLSPDDNARTEHARQVGAENNSLQVQFSGWYLVYSSVYFRPRTNRSCGNLRHQTWGHFIVRRSPKRVSAVLTQSAHTCCDNCTEDSHTSHTAGIFKLEAGDSILVEVSGSGLVLFDGQGSFVGLVMLGSLKTGVAQKHADSSNKTSAR